MGQPIDLIAGLGNPDPEYLTTRHNVGFWTVDQIARQHGVSFSANKKLDADTAEVSISGQRVRLLKPMTYMNESGRAVAKAINYFKIPVDRILVVYDEIDFPPGRVRLKFGGGHAGHNGIRSIITHVGADFWRIRIGVGHPGDRSKVSGHVLRRAPAAEEETIMTTVQRAIDILPTLLDQGSERAMTLLHTEADD